MPDFPTLDAYIESVAASLPDGSFPPSSAFTDDSPAMKIIHDFMNKYPNFTLPVHTVAVYCLSSIAPEKALLRLKRLVDSGGGGVFDGISMDTLFRLSRIIAASGALAERMAGRPSLIDDFSRLDNPLSPGISRDYYLNRIGFILNGIMLIPERIKALHGEHTLQLMRICARNADTSTPIQEINRELAALAEAIVETCLAFAYEDLAARQQTTTPHFLIVLGLGKLGGKELNVSSDIDLIYLIGDDSRSYGNLDALRFHTMLAERLTRIVGEATEGGIFYRVDTRLRADGASGPLVRTTQDYLRYLEMRGEAWERQMLLKARPIAGDIKTGEAFLKSLERFIFPGVLARSPNREIVEIKNRIEARIVAEGSKKTHLKLVPGGVRDIEFVTQCLQLLMGGIHPEVRETGTLPSLAKLWEFGALNAEEYRTLAEGYILYRKIENALQWRELLSAFSLPDAPGEMDEIAYSIGYGNCGGIKLAQDIAAHLVNVRAVFDAVFGASEDESFEDAVLYAAAHPSGDDRTRRFLEGLGFGDSEQAGRTLARLVYGEGVTMPGDTVHDSIRRFIPKLLRHTADLSDPGGALERFARMAESYRARHMLFDVLDSTPSFFELLMTIAQGSLFIADIIAKDPSLLDWLVETGEIRRPISPRDIDRELKRAEAETDDDLAFTRACLTVKNREKLRIATRDITGLAATAETFGELTLTAECILKAVYSRAVKSSPFLRSLPGGYAFAVLAAGRLGAGMMDFGSDLDLIYVFSCPGESVEITAAQEKSVKLARQIQSLLTGGGGPFKVYDVDARLRPEGENAVLAVSLDEYRRYLDQRASAWERLALTRIRAVAGNAKLGNECVEAIGRFVYRGPFSPEDIEKIMEIRATMIEKSRARHKGVINVKSGTGGIVDIDFIAQTYTAHYGNAHETLRVRETPSMLKTLGETGLIGNDDTVTLTELYAFLCDVEKTIRIGSGRSINTLPETEAETARIARQLGFRNTRRFRNRLEDTLGLTAERYDRLMRGLLDRTKNGE